MDTGDNAGFSQDPFEAVGLNNPIEAMDPLVIGIFAFLFLLSLFILVRGELFKLSRAKYSSEDWFKELEKKYGHLFVSPEVLDDLENEDRTLKMTKKGKLEEVEKNVYFRKIEKKDNKSK